MTIRSWDEEKNSPALWALAQVMESIEFPQLVTKYGVFGVPKTMINEQTSVEGALPEDKFLSEIFKAVQINI